MDSDWWLSHLFLNLLGYSTILLPGALLIYYVKKTRFLDSTNSRCLQRILRPLVYGQEVDQPSLEEGPLASAPPASEKTPAQQFLVLLFCFAGLQVSYLTWGLLQEKIMTKEYTSQEGLSKKFSDSQFLVFINRILSFTFALVYLCLVQQPKHCSPLYKYSYCSISNIMSSWCQYEALKYVSFPTQVLAKTCKIIPVMLMGKVVSKKSYDRYEYGTAVMISLGMTMFLLFRDTSDKSGPETTLSGVIILVGYLVFDSFTSNWQGQLFSTYKVSPMQMMAGVNLFSCLFTSVSLLQQGSFSQSLAFMASFPSFFTDCLLLSIFSMTGQLFIFYTISQFGPVVFVIIMTIRQAIAILLSCIIYQHHVGLVGLVGVVIVFAAIFVRLHWSQRKKKEKIMATGTRKNGTKQSNQNGI